MSEILIAIGFGWPDPEGGSFEMEKRGFQQKHRIMVPKRVLVSPERSNVGVGRPVSFFDGAMWQVLFSFAGVLLKNVS